MTGRTTTGTTGTTGVWRERVRRAMPVESDLAFRRRCETVLEFLDAGPGDHVLDCGSGYGFYLRLVPALTGADVTGVDVDADRVTYSRERLGDDPRVHLVHASVEELPFPDGAFTHVICSEVLEHLPDDGAALRELHRVLRPGGRLIVTVPSRDYPLAWDPPNFLLERVTGRHLGGERPWSGIWYGHRRLYDLPTLTALVAGAGFVVEETRPLSHAVPPFAHLVLYGLLKPLLLRGLLPGALARSGDRFADHDAHPTGWGVRAAMRGLEWIDRPNDDPDRVARERTFVAIALRARRDDPEPR